MKENILSVVDDLVGKLAVPLSNIPGPLNTDWILIISIKLMDGRNNGFNTVIY